MTTVSILGGTGYAGSHLVRELARRGHTVRSFSRHAPSEPVAGVDVRTGSATDDATLQDAVDGADAVVVALSPRGDMVGRVRPVIARVAELASAAGVRLGVIGGAGSLHVGEGGPRLIDTDAFPDAARAEATELMGTLEDLRARQDGLDWFYVSPAGAFGAFNPGTARGQYRTGGDVLLVDADGKSELSGPDLASAVADEIEHPVHHRQRFTVAY